MESATSPCYQGSASHLGVNAPRIFLRDRLPAYTGTSNRPLYLSFFVAPSLVTNFGGTGIMTSCPSPTLFSLGLGPANPGTINVAQETLGLRRTCFSHVSRYLFRHSHFHALQPCSRSTFTARGTLLYHATAEAMTSAASVPDLSPDHCRRHTTRPVSYYAFFK